MAKLAINGGAKANPQGHTKYPVLTEQDIEAVNRSLKSGIHWGIYGPEITGLEKEWNEFVGSKYCLSANSGTAALHMAIAAAGVKPGDEVITSSLTFVASALCALQHNAVPVFCDVDPRTFNMDVTKLEAKITEKTKAIIPVDLHGQPCDYDEINAIAKKYDLVVIDDCCQSHGATYKGRNVGTLADMSVFSLNGLKNLECGDGGLFNTDNEDFYNKANQLRVFGEKIQEGVPRNYDSEEIGWCYRLLEMPAAYARSKLTHLADDNKLRQSNAQRLTEGLTGLTGLITPYVPEDRTSVWHYYRIRFDPAALGISMDPNEFRARVQKALIAEGCDAKRWQTRPVQKQVMFQKMTGYGYGCPWTCPFGSKRPYTYGEEDYAVTEQILKDSIVFYDPLYPPNGADVIDRYIDAFRKIWENMDEVLDFEIDMNDPAINSL